MPFIIILLTLFIVVLNGITTIPFSIGLLVITAALSRKLWVFFFAFGLGLFLDLSLLRPLGQTGLVLTIFVFILFLYERKFEIRTSAFVFISTFLGSVFYLLIFGYNNVLIQSFVSAIIGVLIFRLIKKLFN